MSTASGNLGQKGKYAILVSQLSKIVDLEVLQRR